MAHAIVPIRKTNRGSADSELAIESRILLQALIYRKGKIEPSEYAIRLNVLRTYLNNQEEK